MKPLYLESSSVLCWLNGEPEADEVITLMDQTDILITSIITTLEVRRCLIRREASQEITPADRNRLLGLLEQRLPGCNIMELSPEIINRAGQGYPSEPVRTLDALHLATILELIRIYPDLQVLSLDNRIRQNLEPLGLTQVPTTPSIPSSESR